MALGHSPFQESYPSHRLSQPSAGHEVLTQPKAGHEVLTQKPAVFDLPLSAGGRLSQVEDAGATGAMSSRRKFLQPLTKGQATQVKFDLST
jgi:hypothetical protein